MTDTALLNMVKTGLGISGDYQDEILKIHIDNVKQFMISAGVAEAVVNSKVSVGAILIGVNDLWNYSSGGVKFSEMFKQRLIQLSAVALDKPIQSLTLDIPTAETYEVFGWFNTVAGYALNMTSNAFTCTDEEIIKARVEYADGSEATAENDTTGNRRRILFGARYMTVMPETIYDAAQGKFVDNVGTTVIQVQSDFAGGRVALETFFKVV